MLVVLRGNSGSGKSSVAREVRLRYGHRDLAIVSQDVVRRQILREKDVPGGANIDLLDTITRWSLHRGYHVLLEGILDSGRYGAMLKSLVDDHSGPSFLYYLDIPLAETLRRHNTRPQRHEFSAQDMTSWYRAHDLLPGGGETVIGADQSLEDTVGQILDETGLRARAERLR